jgi:AraC-like DNA-binding protein
MSTPTCVVPLRSQPFDCWVDRCQMLVGVTTPDARLNGETLFDVVASLPGGGLTVRQQELAGHLLARLFWRFVSTLDRRIVADLARGALAGDEVNEWFTASQRLAGLVVRASAYPSEHSRPQATRQYADARVELALAEIDSHFANPRFGLRVVAGRVALSDCRLTQLLKSATGRSFGAHLHHRRIAAARTLLTDSALSIKEVASRVGYQSTTQLDRQFKKITHSLPSAYRTAARRLPDTPQPGSQ